MGTLYGKADLDPAEWRHLGIFYRGESEDIAWSYRDDERELLEQLTGDPYADWLEAMRDVHFHENGGCASCGTHFAHGAVFERNSTERIALGHTCAADYFGLASKADLRTREAKKGAERRKLKEAWERQLADNPAFAAAVAWGTKSVCSFCKEVMSDKCMANGDPIDLAGSEVCSGRRRGDLYTNHAAFYRDGFISDVARRGRQYGGATERQVEAVIKAHARGLEREAERARQAKADAMAEDCPQGKVTITGKVLGTREQENPFSYYGGTITKMLVQADEGYKVWSTAPAAINDAGLKGARIRFNATVTPSDDNPKFGFASRPSKAERLES